MEKGMRKRRKRRGRERKDERKNEGGLREAFPHPSLKTGLVERCGLRSKEESEERHSPVISLTHKLLAIPCLCWSQLGNVLFPSLRLSNSFPFPLFFSHLHSSPLYIFFFFKPILLTTVGVSRKHNLGNRNEIPRPLIHDAWQNFLSIPCRGRDRIRYNFFEIRLASSRSVDRG